MFQEDIEDFAKEYFNVLCGQIAAVVYLMQHTFFLGLVFRTFILDTIPSGTGEQLVLNYTTISMEKCTRRIIKQSSRFAAKIHKCKRKNRFIKNLELSVFLKEENLL